MRREQLFGIMKASFTLEDGISIKTEKDRKRDGGINLFLESMFTRGILRKIKGKDME